MLKSHECLTWKPYVCLGIISKKFTCLICSSLANNYFYKLLDITSIMIQNPHVYLHTVFTDLCLVSSYFTETLNMQSDTFCRIYALLDICKDQHVVSTYQFPPIFGIHKYAWMHVCKQKQPSTSPGVQALLTGGSHPRMMQALSQCPWHSAYKPVKHRASFFVLPWITRWTLRSVTRAQPSQTWWDKTGNSGQDTFTMRGSATPDPP